MVCPSGRAAVWPQVGASRNDAARRGPHKRKQPTSVSARRKLTQRDPERANQRPGSAAFLKLSSSLGASRCETSAHATTVAWPLAKSTVFTLVFSNG